MDDVSLALQTVLSQQTSIAADVSALRTDVGKALTHLEVLDARNRTADELHRDFEARIRLLERFRYTVAGVSVVGGTAAGFIGYLLGHVIH